MKLLQDQPNNITLLTNPEVLRLIESVLDVGAGTVNNHGNQKTMNAKRQTNTPTTTTNKQQNKTLTPEQKQSLLEHENLDVIKRKEEIAKILKEQERLACINPELIEQEKTKRNEFFQKADYPSTLKHYT
ncbi:unnamed protein product [Rotaria sordida]|uniref:Uncharacterized protein n=2 Tax=Rotaria sordida TaxID=392033 RepID=A0A819J1Y1_9BILA|nr:unnamed protein product [Rotaria sordida]